MRDKLLEKKFYDSLKEIDEVISKDPANESKHLHNTLAAITAVFNNSNNYRTALEKLYTSDPYMKDATDALATTSLIVSGVLPDVKDFFDTFNITDNKAVAFSDYIFEVQQELAVKFTEHYSKFVTCNEDFELSLIGDS